MQGTDFTSEYFAAVVRHNRYVKEVPWFIQLNHVAAIALGKRTFLYSAFYGFSKFVLVMKYFLLFYFSAVVTGINTGEVIKWVFLVSTLLLGVSSQSSSQTELKISFHVNP